MDIMSFRLLKYRMIEKVDPKFHHQIEEHITYTLNILGQETMSAEAIAIIITSCTK